MMYLREAVIQSRFKRIESNSILRKLPLSALLAMIAVFGASNVIFDALKRRSFEILRRNVKLKGPSTRSHQEVSGFLSKWLAKTFAF